MDRSDYIALMKFPKEWVAFDMLPQELVSQLMALYEPGHECASEHDRNGVFHWWLKKQPEKPVLEKLALLTFLDPDQIMAEDVRRYMAQSFHADEEIIAIIERGGSSI